jgi:hypothetical protein
MCNFFSFTTKGDGVPMYFNTKLRKQINKGKLSYEVDSHTSINDYFGLRGADEDKTNKYEFILGNPHKFIIDQMNAADDSGKCRKWINKFIKTKEYSHILGTLTELDLSGCDLKGITLPTTIGGSLYLRGCDKTEINILRNKYNNIISCNN